MKLILIVTAILFSNTLTSNSFNFENKNTSTITFKMSKLKNTKGQILIALFNSENTYLKKGFKLKSASILNKEEVIVSFNDIPEGTYAASFIHDENNSGDLDTGWLKIPKEPYAFSNNARGTFGPASFEDAKFEVNGDKVVQEIFLK